MRPFILSLLVSSAACAAELYFDGPEVIKLDWNTSSPRAGDFNGDGLTDLALLNQDRARIEFLLQRKEGAKPGEPERTSRADRWNPILEVSRLEKQPFVIGRSAWSLAVGDWNGDQKPDIAYTTDEEKLVLRTQGKPGDWSAKKEFVLDSISEDSEVLLAVDLNGDKRSDIALLTNTRLMVWLQATAGGWMEAKSYVISQAGAGGLRCGDLNGDGKLDLFYTAPDADALLVRLQQDDTDFGEEWQLEMPESRCWVHPVKLGKQTGLAWIRNDTGRIEIAKLAQVQAEPDTDRSSAIRYAMPSTEAKGGATALGDLNGDQLPDVIMAEPKNARLWFFAGRAGGAFAAGREFPALSGIESLHIADVDADGVNEVALLSPGEKSIGIARWQKDRLTYPEVIHQGNTTDSLLTLTTGAVANGPKSIHCLSEAKSKVTLLSLRWSAADKKFQSSTQELPSAPNKPNALRILDANQDGRGDLALFSSLAPLQILISQTDTKTPFKRVEGLPDNLLNKLSASALTTADLDGDGKAEIIIAKDQLARAVRVSPEGKAITVDQFNAPESTAQLSAVLVTQQDGKPQVLLADSANSCLYELSAGADSVFRVNHTHALSGFTPDEYHLLPTEKGSALLMLGKTSFEISPLSGLALKLDTVTTFDSELKDTAASDLVIAPFTGAPTDDLLLVDSGKSRVVELFKAAAESPPSWSSALYFRVFEMDPQYRGKAGLTNEPHDYAALDLNGDGKLDLALLVHDRLLLYLRK